MNALNAHNHERLYGLVRRALALLIVTSAGLGAVLSEGEQAAGPGQEPEQQELGVELAGQVVDAKGIPIAGAYAMAWDERSLNDASSGQAGGPHQVAVDETGSFRLTLPPATYIVRVGAGECQPVQDRIDLTNGPVSRWFLLVRTGTIYGYVMGLPPYSGEGLYVRARIEGTEPGEGSEEGVAGAVGRVNSDYTYMIPRLSEGKYSLAVIVAGQPYEVVYEVFVPAGVRTRVDIPAPPLATLTGHVVPSEAGIRELTVDLAYADGRHDPKRVAVSEGGVYKIEGLRAGAAAVAALAKGFVMTRRSRVELGEGQVTTFDIEFGTGSVSGTVVEAGTNRPVAGARVRLQSLEVDWQAEGTGGLLMDSVTGADGRYKVRGLPEGPYMLVAEADELAPRSYRFDSDGRGELLFSLRLSRGVHVAVLVEDTTGQPEPNARLLLEDEAGLIQIGALTDEQGRAVLNAVPEGEFTLMVYYAMDDASQGGSGSGVSVQKVVITGATTRLKVVRPEGT